MKALTKISIGFLALAAVALWFTSCSSEDVAQNGGSLNEKDQRVLLLSVNTGNLGTRSALTDDEKQINDMTVGIYDETGGNCRVVASLASGSKEEVASGTKPGTFTTASGVKVKVVTSTLQENDKVLVAVNSGTTAFASKPNSLTKFSEVTMDATTALQFKASSTDIDATKFPKFGTAKLPAGSTSTFQATVSVKNLVSKVTLEDLSVSFTGGPYASATFTPEKLFLLNVPNKLAFSTTGQASTSTSGFAYLNGTNIDKSGGTAGTETAVLAKTITGAHALSSAAGGTASFTDKPILYTIPNSSTSNKTILVIAGNFKKDGSGAGETVYYPLALNEDYSSGSLGTTAPDGGTVSQTLAGKNYKCKVVIKTIGASNPWVTTGPQTAELTVNVADWDDADQTTTFE